MFPFLYIVSSLEGDAALQTHQALCLEVQHLSILPVRRLGNHHVLEKC